MGSTEDPFTRRMLQRAASVRKNPGASFMRSSPEDSSRRMSILQAILVDAEPLRIEDVTDCRIDSTRATPSGVNVFADDEQRRAYNQKRRSSVATDSRFLSRRSMNSKSFCSNVRSDSSYPRSRFKLGADYCENSPKLTKSSGGHANCGIDGIESADARDGIVNNEEQQSPRGCSRKSDMAEFKSEVDGKNNVTQRVAEASRGTNSYEGFENSGNRGDNSYDGNKNSLDSIRTFNPTSLNITNYSITSTSYAKGFELGKVTWRGPLSAAYAKSRVQTDRNLPRGEPFNVEKPELVKAVHTEILTPQKMRLEVKTVGNFHIPKINAENVQDIPVNKSCANERPTDKLSVGIEATNELATEGSVSVRENQDSAPATPLSSEIRKLDEEIERLSLRPNLYTRKNCAQLAPPERIYPNSSKIRFTPTAGYSPEKLWQSPDGRPAQDHDGDSVFETPAIIRSGGTNVENESDESAVTNIRKRSKAVKNDKFKPDMESTLNSSFDNFAKTSGSPGSGVSSVFSVTTAAPNDTPEVLEAPGSSSSPNAGRNVTLDSTMPYNIDNFLSDALGDELYNTTVTYPPSETANDNSVSQFNASQLISEERTPRQNNKKPFSKNNSGYDPRHQNPSTFNRTTSIYRSITRGIKKKLAPGLKSTPGVMTKSDRTTVPRDSKLGDKKIQTLLREANIQETLMYQANKALTVCHSMKEFASSTEQVESERSLLVSGLRRAAVVEEIERLNNGSNNNNDVDDVDDDDSDDRFSEMGEVVIKDFSIPLKEHVLRHDSKTGDFVQWFVIAVTHGASVWATRAVACPVQSPRIIFSGTFSISNLTPNFKITVKIFSLKMRRTTFNHDDKYHLNQNDRIYAYCPSPKKLILGKNERTSSPKRVQRIIEVSSIRDTSFVLSGMVELYLHDLSLSAPWPLTSLKQGSVLCGTIDLTLCCRLHLSVSYAGFLNYGNVANDHCVVWNRRWCVLRGQTLMFWNYPRDQEDKEPLTVVDLTKCVSEKIMGVDRSLCAKPRTLLIETVDRIHGSLLSCDTVQDFGQWKTKLNQVISALRDWNVINRSAAAATDLQISDL